MRKKYVVRWELEGRRVPAGTPGAARRREFVGFVQKIAGKEVLLGRVAETARLVLAEKLRDGELRRRGIMPEVASADGPIGETINEFIASLEAKDRAPQYLGEVRNKLERVIRECDWQRLMDARLEKLEAWLVGKRRADASGGARFSTNTANGYRVAWRSWGNWLVRTGRAIFSPFRGIQKNNAETDRRHVRRSLTPEEVEFLLERVEAGPARAGMSGRDRAMLYRLAVSTGLRARELSSLTPASLHLDHESPHIELGARFAKSRRKALQPIPRALAAVLAPYLARKSKTAPIWPAATPGQNKLGKMLRADCASARGDHPNPAAGFLESRPGAVIDFHALRGTFLTALASKVTASTLGALGRHASVQTTEKHYVNHRLASLAESLEGAGLSWFSNGSPDKRKTMKRNGPNIERAASIFKRFTDTLKAHELKAFLDKIRPILECKKRDTAEV
ncbi:MAG: tyrosine-type recombinase/integrase [Planctomycetota bacterium]